MARNGFYLYTTDGAKAGTAVYAGPTYADGYSIMCESSADENFSVVISEHRDGVWTFGHFEEVISAPTTIVE